MKPYNKLSETEKKELYEEKYQETGGSVAKIAKIFGVSREVANNAIYTYGLKELPPKYQVVQEAVTRIIKANAYGTLTDIARAANISESRLSNLQKVFGIHKVSIVDFLHKTPENVIIQALRFTRFALENIPDSHPAKNHIVLAVSALEDAYEATLSHTD